MNRVDPYVILVTIFSLFVFVGCGNSDNNERSLLSLNCAGPSALPEECGRSPSGEWDTQPTPTPTPLPPPPKYYEPVTFDEIEPQFSVQGDELIFDLAIRAYLSEGEVSFGRLSVRGRDQTEINFSIEFSEGCEPRYPNSKSFKCKRGQRWIKYNAVLEDIDGNLNNVELRIDFPVVIYEEFPYWYYTMGSGPDRYFVRAIGPYER